MSRWLMGFGLIASAALGAAAEPKALWLTIAGSSKTVAPILKIDEKLRPLSPDAAIVASSDCENLAQGLYLSVATVANDRAQAQAALAQAKSVSPDAYVKECQPKPASRILLGVPAVDRSIENVPENAVNWADEDRVSTIMKLPGEGFLWMRRTYNAAPDDPREGRRTSVQFFRTVPRDSVELSADCTDAKATAMAGKIALSCARETAAENLLHQTTVYNANSGKEITAVPHCRDPKFAAASELVCQAEEVDRQGVLHLKPKRVKLP